MIIGVLMLTINDGMAKYLTESYPIGQVITLRSGLIILILWVGLKVSGYSRNLKVNRWDQQIFRASLMTGATFCFILGLSLLPIADAIAITFAGPILTMALAVPLLGETVSWHRWVVISFGLFGVLIIIQPTGDAFKLATLAPLGTAIFGALRDLVTRQISGSESSAAILMISTILITVVGLTTWPFGWNEIQIAHFWIFIASAGLVGLAQYLMIEAFRLAEATKVSPFKYSSLIWAIIIGALIWGDFPDITVLFGALLLVGSGVYLLYDERRSSNTPQKESSDNE